MAVLNSLNRVCIDKLQLHAFWVPWVVMRLESLVLFPSSAKAMA